MNSIYLFSRFFGTKHPNKGTIADIRDYEGWQKYLLLVLFHIVIFSTESVEKSVFPLIIRGKDTGNHFE